MQRFKALMEFANLDDQPESWKAFEKQHPDFFPSKIRETDGALVEHADGSCSTTLAALLRKANLWAECTAALPDSLKHTVTTPLLLFRDFLRKAWAGSDDDGKALLFLLGFEPTAAMLSPVPEAPGTFKQETVRSLSKGHPTVDATGKLVFKFDNNFQQLVFNLLCGAERWRARVCLQCGRFFLATRTAQKHCTHECSQDFKRQRSLIYWNAKGRKIRNRQLAAKRRMKDGEE